MQDLKFVVGSTPEQLRKNATKTVRSHVARMSWQSQDRTHSVQSTTRRRRKARVEITVYEESEEAHPPPPATAATTAVAVARPSSEVPVHTGHQVSAVPFLDRFLGAGRVDPFKSFPAQSRGVFPALVDHYITHMATDIQELDGPGERGLLRVKWFPLVMTQPASFLVIILLSASNFSAVKESPEMRDRLLAMKGDALRSINEAFSSSSENNRLSDAMIGAVAKMASFEAMYGNEASYCVHMAGLRRMVELRGGLTTLGLGGLLRRIIIWIDLNSAFLLKTPRYFPGETFEMTYPLRPGSDEPNPGQFVAL